MTAASIADPGLADAGRDRVEWADAQMPVLRSIRERFAAAVPDGRVVRIGGAAHMPNMERPADFNAALLKFLDQ